MLWLCQYLFWLITTINSNIIKITIRFTSYFLLMKTSWNSAHKMLGIFADTLSAALIVSLHVIIELSMVIANYSPFSQLHVEGFRFNILCTNDILPDFHTNIYHFFTFDSSYICYHQTWIYIRMLYVLLMLSIHLFLLSYYKRITLNLLFCLECILYWIDHKEY